LIGRRYFLRLPPSWRIDSQICVLSSSAGDSEGNYLGPYSPSPNPRQSNCEENHMIWEVIRRMGKAEGSSVSDQDSDSSYARRPQPRLGEHTEEILESFSILEGEVDSLREKGAV